MNPADFYRPLSGLLDVKSLRRRRVAVVGLGSGGSRVAAALGRSGVQLLLVERPNERLKELLSSDKGKRVQLRLEVALNNQPKLAWPILILPGERLTNFEGQLTATHAELPTDEDAYNEILTRLDSLSAPKRRVSK